MARNNLLRHPESINSGQEERSGRSSYSSCHNCCSRAEYTIGDNSGIRGGEAGRSVGEGSAKQQHPNWCGANRVRIGNIAATYLFIGLLLLQSCYLCQGSALPHMTGSSGGVNNGATISYKEPLFITQSAAFKFVIGETISLPCDVTNPAAYVLAWKRGIAILTAGNVKVSPDSRMHLSNGYTLQIADAREQDAGDYICQIATIDPREITHHVEILVPPKIHHVTSGGHLQVKKGSPVRLECSASGNPQPNITWTRKNNVLPNGEDKYVSPTYVIEKMDRHKGGVYICTANNGVGHIAMSQINLHVLFPPEIVIENSLVYSGEREEATLSCTIHGETTPDVAWYKDTMQILPTERLMIETRGAKHSLVIRGVIPTDFGNYSCVASNLLGKERRVVTLTGRPRPVSFQSPSVGQWRDKYNISWTVKSLSPIEEYKLYYKLVSPQHYDLQRSRQPYSSSSSSQQQHNDDLLMMGGYQHQPISYSGGMSWNGLMQNDWVNVSLPVIPFSTTKKSSIQGMSYMMRTLEPDYQYEARVEARNRYGWSDLSQPFLFSTANADTEVRDLGYTFLGGRDSGVERSLRSNGFLMLLGFVVLAAQLLRTH